MSGEQSTATILIVDDNPLNVEMLCGYLEQEGYATRTAQSGVEALESIATCPPDLVLLDAMMPDMDGFELCARLKGDPERRLIPVVMVTALVGLEARVRGIEAGVDDFLSKPIVRMELMARIRTLLRAKRYLDELETAERVIEALVRAIEVRDGYTERHTERVVRRAADLGRAVGLDAESLRVLEQGAMLHDVGKIGIPEHILGKPGELTDEEYAVMKQHTLIGVGICRPLRSRIITAALPIIRSHHERVDGLGYPDGLAGEEIPLAARITSISDAYDAMTSHRPYRQALSHAVAVRTLQAGAGTQWDAELVAQFIHAVVQR